MDTQQTFILISSILIFLVYITYEWSIIVGRSKPHRTTRFVLLLISIIGTASLFAQKDTVAIWFIGFIAFHSFFVFLLSLKYGMGGWKKLDLLCLGIALLGIIVWQVTDSPALGLYASIFADFVCMIPALIKTYNLPDTEYWLSYALDILASIFILLAIEKWEVQGFIYPLYIALINLVMLILIFRHKITRFILKFKL